MSCIASTKKGGSSLVTLLGVLAFLGIASAAYISSATTSIRAAKRQSYTIQTFHLCEAGLQEGLRGFWNPFKQNQNFTDIDSRCSNASVSAPAASINDTVPGVGRFSVGVIGYKVVDSYTRQLLFRCVGYIDKNSNGQLDAGEPRRIIDVNATFELSRSQVFDYAYFVNNYGWMDGFGPTQLIVNGDMRANGDFSFTNGAPTVNGSIYAAYNEKLVPPAQGLVTGQVLKWTDSTYNSNESTQQRWRQGYNSGTHGLQNSSTYAQWSPFIFDSDANIYSNQINGAVMGDANGTRAWWDTSTSTPISTQMLDPTPTHEVIMPDLSNLSYYQNLSSSYVDTKATYQDGTANPNYGQGAWLKVWNNSTNAYQTLTTNGQLTGSAGIVGTSTHPILLHGPVTFTQDVVIKGNVSGQGTIYTGRNVHIVGPILYTNAPDFRGSSMQAIDNANEKKDALGLAARGSIIMGDVSQFTQSYPLQYMTPPFTHARYDDSGNLIPAFNATQTDSTGFMKYQSVTGNSYIHSLAEPVSEMDAILYTNFVGGGDIGTGGHGVILNGSIISKDEAMVVFSLPMYMNYDHRIKERNLNNKPLIDLMLPRSPVLLRSTWQDQGFSMGYSG